MHWWLFTIIVACSFSISPMTEQSTVRVALTIGRNQRNRMDLKQILSATFTSNYSLTNAVIVATNNSNQPVNGSLCQISNLEVYRETRHITAISHDGFSLNDEGFFMV